MATKTQADIVVGPDWKDIVNDVAVGNSSLSGAPVKIVSKSANGEKIYVCFGGASAPSADDIGDELSSRGDATIGRAANIWVRCVNLAAGSDKIGVTLLEG